MSRFHLSQLKTSTLTKHLPANSAIRTPFVITFLNNSNYTTLRRRSDILFPVSRRHFIHRATTSLPSQRYLPVYERQDKVEDLENYRLGGYHPIQLGDKISDARYLVIHKLGYGNYSTVWLAQDRMENRYVSLKILAARQSRVSSEIRIRNRLRGGDLGHLGRPFVLSTLDEFYIDGPNGRHQCLVSEVTGPTILEVKEKSKNGLLPIETAQRIIAQLAVGLAYIHSCDIIHGG